MISINNLVIYFLLKLNNSINSLRLMKLLYIMVRNSTVFGANVEVLPLPGPAITTQFSSQLRISCCW